MSARSPFVQAVADQPAADPWHSAAGAALAGAPVVLPPALSHLAARFDLGEAESQALLLVAARELGAVTPPVTARLALAHGLEWAALAPDAPLRHWRLIELASPDLPLADRPWRLDERVLHHLLGSAALDPDLVSLRPLLAPVPLAPTHAAVAAELAEMDNPVVLTGCDAATRRAVLAQAATTADVPAWRISDIPVDPQARAALALLWSREVRLGDKLLLIEADGTNDAIARDLFDRCDRGAILSADTLSDTPHRVLHLHPLTRKEQAGLWHAAGVAQGDRLASTFDLPAAGIVQAARDPAGPWQAARCAGRTRLAATTEVIEPRAGWNDLILPPDTLAAIRMVAAQAAARPIVYDRWGAARDPARGAGLSALFAGPSGTGKTLAAEVIAAALEVDLARIDLSQLVSKYIGETEKNIARATAAAEAAGAVLLFDEADALFGKRSEVRDAHDRHANLEVSYLLQRMESYRGLALLTSNLPDHLDPAFLRRLRLIVHFPPPERDERARMWARAFPADAPVDGLDHQHLAQLQATGGVIRNIALTAMFMAADAGGPVTMARIRAAAAAEYVKLGRTLYPEEVAGWAE